MIGFIIGLVIGAAIGALTMACCNAAGRADEAMKAESVVHCRECEYQHNRWLGCAKMNGTVMPPDGFCSYGRRRIVPETTIRIEMPNVKLKEVEGDEAH